MSSKDLDRFALDQLCTIFAISYRGKFLGRVRVRGRLLTIDLRYSPREHVLLSLLLRNVFHHVVNDGLDKASLLIFLLLLLKAHPAVEHSLDLGSKRDALALHECVRLKLRSLL